MAAVLAWGTWQKQKVAQAKAELAVVVEQKAAAIAKLKDAAQYTGTLKRSLEMQAEDAEEQARAADAARAKERLAWIRLDKLKKEINSATDNPPIPDALESVLDAYRLRSAVPGDAGNDSADERGDAGTEDPLGPKVSEPAAPTS